MKLPETQLREYIEAAERIAEHVAAGRLFLASVLQRQMELRRDSVSLHWQDNPTGIPDLREMFNPVVLTGYKWRNIKYLLGED